MTGLPQFERKVHGMDELIKEVKKTSDDGKKNYYLAIIATTVAVLSLVVAGISLWRTW